MTDIREEETALLEQLALSKSHNDDMKSFFFYSTRLTATAAGANLSEEEFRGLLDNMFVLFRQFKSHKE